MLATTRPVMGLRPQPKLGLLFLARHLWLNPDGQQLHYHRRQPHRQHQRRRRRRRRRRLPPVAIHRTVFLRLHRSRHLLVPLFSDPIFLYQHAERYRIDLPSLLVQHERLDERKLTWHPHALIVGTSTLPAMVRFCKITRLQGFPLLLLLVSNGNHVLEISYQIVDSLPIPPPLSTFSWGVCFFSEVFGASLGHKAQAWVSSPMTGRFRVRGASICCLDRPIKDFFKASINATSTFSQQLILTCIMSSLV